VIRGLGNGFGVAVVIGRGHNGTRAAARLLMSGGTWMGTPLNSSADLVPQPCPMYDAARLACALVRITDEGPDVRDLVESDPPAEVAELVAEYARLGSLVDRRKRGEWVGWKLPETTMIYPWLVRLLPRAAFLLWGRDPRDVALKPHPTDNLGSWGAQDWPGLDTHRERLLSWTAQTEIVLQSPEPRTRWWTTLGRWAAAPGSEAERIRAALGAPVGDLERQDGPVGRHLRDGTIPGRGSRELAWALEAHRKWIARCG
jgi:hypothetical protein